jgi:hypothetical protein
MPKLSALRAMPSRVSASSYSVLKVLPVATSMILAVRNRRWSRRERVPSTMSRAESNLPRRMAELPSKMACSEYFWAARSWEISLRSTTW